MTLFFFSSIFIQIKWLKIAILPKKHSQQSIGSFHIPRREWHTKSRIMALGDGRTTTHKHSNIYTFVFQLVDSIHVRRTPMCTIRWWSMHYFNNLHILRMEDESECLLSHPGGVLLIHANKHTHTHSCVLCIPAKQQWYGFRFTLPNRDRFSGVGVQMRCEFSSSFSTSIFCLLRQRASFFFRARIELMEHEIHDFWMNSTL